MMDCRSRCHTEMAEFEEGGGRGECTTLALLEMLQVIVRDREMASVTVGGAEPMATSMLIPEETKSASGAACFHHQ